jgi:hypothetical protein
MSHETRKTLADRLRARAAYRRKQAEAASQQSSDAVRHIPLGQPILVGHHSEKRHRRDLARCDAAMQKAARLYRESQELAQRAIGSENNNAIFSDDPDAIPQLETKLAELIQQRDRNTAINKLVRKKDRAGLLAMGLKEATVDALFTPDYGGRTGIPPYVNSNLSGNITRVKQRIQELTAKRANESREFEVGDITITEDVEADRLRITFPGKPDAATIKTLKSYGFRWSPSVGAWQRNLNNGARYACQQVLGMEKYPPTQA